jgi:predicted DNA-binding ribbon-helix-helix protein
MWRGIFVSTAIFPGCGADVRLEALAALERLAGRRNLSLTMLIEELAIEADRRTAQKLTGEALVCYRAGEGERSL